MNKKEKYCCPIIRIFILTFMFIFAVGKPLNVRAANYKIYPYEALNNVYNYAYNWLREGDEIWFTLEGIVESDDRLLQDYLSGQSIEVFFYDPVSDYPQKLTPDSEGVYRWKVPFGWAGQDIVFYFNVIGGDVYYTSDFRIKELKNQNIGNRTIDLTGKAVNVSGYIDSINKSEAEVISITLYLLKDFDGTITLSEDYNSDRETYDTDIDLDKDGTKDVRLSQADVDSSIGSMEYISTCSVSGSFTAPLSAETKFMANQKEIPYYGSITFKLPTIIKQSQTISVLHSSFTKSYGSADFNLGAETSGDGILSYTSSNNNVAKVSSEGKVKIKGTGTSKITVKAAATTKYKAASKTVTIIVNKGTNPLKVSPKVAKIKYNQLKKKNQVLAVTKVIDFKKKIDDKKIYTLLSAKKGNKNFKKYFKIDKNTGKVTVKKGLKKGVYKIKIKVKASGNANYKASSNKTVTFTVKIV